MELIVHGTKGGYRILYSSPNAPSIASDLRDNVSSENTLGQSLYSISFAANGCVFTKYSIVRDSLRGYAIGTIAFSLYLTADKELSGKGRDVKELLDKVFSYYADYYIYDNNINRGETTTIIQEDWTFINSILSEFKEQDKTQQEGEMQPGIKDAAFIYYQNDSDLFEYLGKPFQDEYNDYKRIFFININLKGNSSNPIYALRNSGVELKDIHLNNEYYYLNNYNREKGVLITSNGKPCSEEKNNNLIRAKSLIKIYSTEDKFYYPIEESGTLSNPESKIHKYLEIRGNSISIKYEARNQKTQTVIFEIKDHKGSLLTNAEIQIDNHEFQKQFNYTFKGEDIGKQFKVVARKGENFVQKEEFFTPESIRSPFVLILEKQMVVKLIVQYPDGKPVSVFDFQIGDKKGNSDSPSELVFKGDKEIEKNWKIIISKQNEGFTYSKIIKYNPKTGENPLRLYLIKENSTNETRKWVLGDKMRGIGKIMVLKQKVIAGFATIITVIVLGIWIVNQLNKPNDKSQLIDKDRILNYVNGGELISDTLNNIKLKWEDLEPSISQRNPLIFRIFKIGVQRADSADFNNWDVVMQNIKLALKIRDAIIRKSLDSLKSFQYSDAQRKFKEKINFISSDTILKSIGNIDNMTLNAIADSINTLVSLKSIKYGATTYNNEKERKGNLKDVGDVEIGSSESRQIVLLDDTPKNAELIIQYLKGSELKKETLEDYRNITKDENLIKSIELALEFWKLDGTKNTYFSYKKKLQEDSNFKKSELQIFVNEMCNKKHPKYVGDILGGKAKITTLTELKNAVQ